MRAITEVYEALKLINKGNVSDILKELENYFSAEWRDTTVQKASIKRKIKNKLDLLIELGLVVMEEKKNRKGENIYAIKHYFPVQSKAPKLVEELLTTISGDKKIYIQALKPIHALLNEIKSPYFIRDNSENIESLKDNIATLETAINDRKYIEITYHQKRTKVRPLKIAEFDGIWYLLHFYDKYGTFLKYRLSEIEDIVLTHDQFELDDSLKLEIEKWHNVWHVPNIKPTEITLWIEKGIETIFRKKNLFDINAHVGKITPCHDGIEYRIDITHPYEVLPILMQYQPYVTVIKQQGDIDLIGTYRTILDETISRLPDKNGL